MKKLKSFKNTKGSATLSSGGEQFYSTTSPSTTTTTATPIIGAGLFTKLTKHYSNVRFLRNAGNRNKSPQPMTTTVTSMGSYDMTGNDSEDLKREIGAPILISKTRIDMDEKDYNIGSPIPNSLRVNLTMELEESMLPTTINDIDCNDGGGGGGSNGGGSGLGDGCVHEPISPITSDDQYQSSSGCTGEYDLTSTVVKPRNISTLLRKKRSKSACNLHKSEIKVYLNKAPSSIELEQQHPPMVVTTSSNDEDEDESISRHGSYNVIRQQKQYLSTDIDTDYSSSYRSVSASGECKNKSSHRTFINNNLTRPQSSMVEATTKTTVVPSVAITGADVVDNVSDNLESNLVNHQRNHRTQRSHSRDSLMDPNYDEEDDEDDDDVDQAYSEADDDFDMKSASFQSLDARNLFLSIEELNEITRQINESEQFNNEIDLEYCEHRDKLRPDQRRITLLRNKNARGVLNFDHKKEKLTNAWSGLKHWVGEERTKFKEVIHKHAALQSVGASTRYQNNQQQQQQQQQQNQHHHQQNNIVRNADFFDRIQQTPSASTSQRQSMFINTDDGQLNQPNSSIEPTICIDGKHISGVLLRNDLINDSEKDFDEDSLNRRNGTSNLNINDQQIRSRTQSRVYSSEEREGNINVPGFIQSLMRTSSKTSSSKASSSIPNNGEGQNGFEELRRYVKQGGDFGKDLVSVLQERFEAEQLYAKSLTKMASKLSKACREIPGSLADAWRGVATEMESRSEVHRQFSNSIAEDIVKPMKLILENQHKTRKTIESTVDKSSRILSEWRTTEAKAKKSSHAAARENEKLQDAMLDVRIQRSPSVAMLHAGGNHKSPEKEIKSAEKDCAKLDNKRRKAEDAVKRADVEYYTLCIRAERARVEWEMSVLRGSTILQTHENQRLANLKNYLNDYLKFSNQMNPNMSQLCERLTPYVQACNVQKDLNVVKNIRRASEGPSEQLLPDFYCEHTTLAMNRERRKHALVKLLQLVRTDLERERKSRCGLKELSHTLNATENQNITDKLYHIRSMLTYLEGARFKLQSALLELDHKPRGTHPLAPHIQITRDRTGLQQSILKVPLWLRNGDENSDHVNQEFTDTIADINELELMENGDNERQCVDGRNEVLIKHFDRNFNRSKSSIDYKSKDIVVITNDDGGGGGGGGGGGLGGGSVSAGTEIINHRNSTSPVFDRGIADGGSNQPDSDFDEFSSQDEDDDLNTINKKTTSTKTGSVRLSAVNNLPVVISRCRALYNYSPKLYDELELTPGDIIEVHTKQDDGWWLGELKNKIGIFPATYVEEVN